jgi:N-acetylneuraminate synthase
MDQANLRQIPELAKRFDVLAGLSDHTMGTTAAVASIALGACLIEKHFTLSRADFERQQVEEGSKVFRRSLYFVKDLPAGHVIEPGDIRRIRPRMGLAPKWFDEVVVKQVKSDVKAGLAVDWDISE